VPIRVPIAVDGLSNVTEWVHTDPEIARHRDRQVWPDCL
jgi:hypothetical protein